MALLVPPLDGQAHITILATYQEDWRSHLLGHAPANYSCSYHLGIYTLKNKQIINTYLSSWPSVKIVIGMFEVPFAHTKKRRTRIDRKEEQGPKFMQSFYEQSLFLEYDVCFS